jgi:DNA-binding response OmpR family regulator
MGGEATVRRILWVDDEIDLLRAHVLLLEQRGYRVETAANGEDAVEMVRRQVFDLVLLDEMMPGMGGLRTLSAIKDVAPSLPVVMITKNEAESLMEEAVGSKITDYLLKPINPNQVLVTCRKILDARKITGDVLSRDYAQEFQQISRDLAQGLSIRQWIDLHGKLTSWEMEFEARPELGLQQTLSDQRREANAEFSKYVERSYRDWLELEERDVLLSTDIVPQIVLPRLEDSRSVFLIVVDCLRLDQWLVMEQLLADWYHVERDYYLSILPSATPYARNAIFSGLFPRDLEQRFPEVWQAGDDDENSRNRHEHQLLEKLLERKRVVLKPEAKYVKILDPEFGKQVESNILSFAQGRLTAIVVNFVDMLAHGRSDSQLLKEIAPDESAYRSLTRSWFQHSSLLGMLRTLSRQRHVRIILTTDHGSIRCLRGAKIIGDREASTNLRYKFGRNLRVESRYAVLVKDPADYRLPRQSVTTNYAFAKEDYYFVYPTDYHRYLNQYRDSFQHGGISMEEMILPLVTLTPR